MTSENESDEIAAKEAVIIHAHNAMVWWASLKCDEGHLLMPVKFVVAMEDLDRDVERLRRIQREKPLRLPKKDHRRHTSL